MGSQAGDVLRRAAADVEVRGVTRFPDRRRDETCAVYSIERQCGETIVSGWQIAHRTFRAFAAVIGTKNYADWNDSRPSKAVVAAEMRSAGDLADLLYGGAA